jgi:CRISPR-associated protein Csb2
MLSLGIRYLNGFVAASEPDDRERPEWPPHPARVFMALAAAHFQTGADPREREVLLWLESLPAPALRASAATAKAVVRHYVPVNDKPVWKKDPAKPQQNPPPPLQSTPGVMRVRQDRVFTRAWLEDDVAYLVWHDVMPEQPTVEAFARLCGKVTRIGHSMSLVQMWVARPEEVDEVNWVPDDERSKAYLRVPRTGTLVELEWRYKASAVGTYASLAVAAENDRDRRAQREAKRRLKDEFGGRPPVQLRPHIATFQGYSRRRRPDEERQLTGTVFSPHLVIFGLERRKGRFASLGLEATLQVVQRWREALISHCDGAAEDLRAIVSGHRPDGGPLKEPHLALAPLAFVGHPNADGRLLGLAAALPARIDPEQRRQVLRILGRVDELRLGSLGVWGLIRELGEQPPWNLRSETWTAHSAGATQWSTVTPVAFDRHPKKTDRVASQQETAEMAAAACAAIALPRPCEVVMTAVSAHLGVPTACSFTRLARKDGSERRHAHAILIFDEPVRGPILLGAGRYRGYGLCRPITK